MSNTTPSPVLKWVGGKRQLLPAITPHIPRNISLYVEPFVGGAAVLLAQLPERARINDSNTELINVYITVRDNPQALIEKLREHDSMNSREYFYRIRALDRTEDFGALSEVERAARIIYLNKTCYNGLYRVNSCGQLNTPYGNYKNPNIVNQDGIESLSEYLNGHIQITAGDYAEALKNLPSNSFVYLDPPYMPISSTSAFTGYTAGGFNYSDQVRLRDACVNLASNGTRFVQSNSDCTEIRDLYRDFRIETVRARRAVNSKATRRNEINEVLIIG